MLQIQIPDHSGDALEILLVYHPVQKTQNHQWAQQFLSTLGAWQEELLEREP